MTAPGAQPYGAPPAYGTQQPYGAAQPYGTPAATPASYAANPPPAAQPLYGTPRQMAPQPLAPQSAAPVTPAPARTASAGGGAHVVTSGESLSSLARRYGVSRSVLASANGLAVDAPVRIGQRLTIPGAGTTAVASAAPAASASSAPTPAASAALAKTKPVEMKPVAQAPAKPAEPKAQTIAAVKPAESAADVEKEEQRQAVQFRWPVRGRIISGFGPKPGGQQNEGINVSVPEGTSVKAAEDGVVAYAGNELKGYGNLVLIKHADGWVTAYAHNSEIDVKKGEAVKRGQTIAKAGQTGNVTSPQVHFEIRRGSQAVDPSQHLAGL